MKKIAIGSVIFLIIGWFSIDYFSGYKVLKIIDGDTIYVDLNRDDKAQKDEKIRIKSIDAFETKYSYYLTKQALKYNISKKQALGIGYLGKEFAKKKLLGKRVKVQLEGKGDFKRKLAHIYILWWNYEKDILKAGLAGVFDYSDDAKKYKNFENINKIKNNAKEADKFNLVLLNLKNNKYHKPFCKYAKNMSHYEVLQVKDLPKEAKQAGCCENLKEEKKVYDNAAPDVSTEFINLYFIDPTKYKKPAKYCRTSACQALLNEIKNAKKSIYFAIYGISNQPDIFYALIDAKNKGIDVKGIIDMNSKNRNIYGDSKLLIDTLGNKRIQTDYIVNDYNSIETFDIHGAIMHNKFFIFDDKSVWTGSTNISSTGTGGYNANIGVLLKSNSIAKIYNNEFYQMFYKNKFHQYKTKLNYKPLTLPDQTILSVHFSPKDKILSNEIITLINNAKESIYIPIFFLTNKKVILSLINAKKRGVDVRVIIDAISAANRFSKHTMLRKEGVKVKVENWGGKMHCKSAIIDNEYIIIGSMNWTKSAEFLNDENTLIIKSNKLALSYKEHFLYLWNKIPAKWLYDRPRAEGIESVNSCFDGVDNDHDGSYDSKDYKCSN